MDTGAAQTLIETVEQLSTATTLERVTEVVAHATRTLMGADGATFVLREDDKCFYADENAIGPLWKGSRFPLTACISGWAMLNDETVVVPDIYVDARIPHDAYRPTFVNSLVMAPIRGTTPVGALGAYWSDHHVPTPSDLRLQEMLANSAAVALQNLELRGAVSRRSAERDELESAIHTLVHDLRSPLGAMMGYAELIDWDAEDADKVRLFARTILTSGQRMAAQIDTMLALYRITTQPLNPARVDLTAVAREIAGELVQQAGDRAVTITVDDDLSAVMDPVLARLMLQNLLDNAVKYTGKVTQAEISVRSEGPGGFVVRDNGAGFASADADRLFEPLVRLHGDEEFAGTGLGLASVARIVGLHGGEITAEGTPGQGAAFHVTLPPL